MRSRSPCLLLDAQHSLSMNQHSTAPLRATGVTAAVLAFVQRLKSLRYSSRSLTRALLFFEKDPRKSLATIRNTDAGTTINVIASWKHGPLHPDAAMACFLHLEALAVSDGRPARLKIITELVSSPHVLRSMLQHEASRIDGFENRFEDLHRASAAAVALSYEALADMDAATAIDLVWAAEIFQRRDVTPPHWFKDENVDSLVVLSIVFDFHDGKIETLRQVCEFIDSNLAMELPSGPFLALSAATQATADHAPVAHFRWLTKPLRENTSLMPHVADLIRAGAPGNLRELAIIARKLELQ